MEYQKPTINYLDNRFETFIHKASSASIESLLNGPSSNSPLGKYVKSNPDLIKRLKNRAKELTDYWEDTQRSDDDVLFANISVLE